MSLKNIIFISFLLLSSPGFVRAQTPEEFDLTGDWIIDEKNICASLEKDNRDYKVRDCGDPVAKSKYTRISRNKYKKNSFVFIAKDKDHIYFTEGSNEKWTRKKVADQLAKLPPLLSIQDIVLSKSYLNAGEMVQLSVSVKNVGAGDASGVQAVLTTTTKGISFAEKTVFPKIDKNGGTQTITIDINGSIDIPTAEALLKIEVTEPGFKIKLQGKQVKFQMREFAKPDLLLAKFAVLENLSANPNNQIDINEQIDVKFAVQNIGTGSAEAVSVNVRNDQTGVMFLGVVDDKGNLIRKDPSFDAIESGKYETITYRYFVNSEFQNSKLSFSITAREKHGKFGLANAMSVEINKALKEEGYIRTVEAKHDFDKPKVVIEDIGDFVSDVDVDIPINTNTSEKTFAVVIGNERYVKEMKVKYAMSDARSFKQYLIKTLAIPEKNIHYSENATYGQMLDALKWIADVSKAYNGEAKIIFYYAGHGMPDEETKSAYLLPSDGNSQNLVTAVKVADVYTRLNEFPSQSVTVILDACFSGSSREETGAMLAQGRGVKIKPKGEAITGKMVVISATTGDETAFPYNDKQHGMFTYFLLKKLKESRGTVNFLDLTNYIITNVSQQSVLINKKSQTPQVNIGQEVMESWKTMTLK